MKKINKKLIVLFIVLIFIVFLIVTYLIDSKNTKTLTCTASGSSSEIETESTLEIKVNNKKIKDMEFTVDMIFPEDLLDQRQSYVNMIRQTKPYMSATVTDDGIRIVTKEQGGSFIGIDTTQEITVSELKQVLEIQGYTCKES